MSHKVNLTVVPPTPVYITHATDCTPSGLLYICLLKQYVQAMWLSIYILLEKGAKLSLLMGDGLAGYKMTDRSSGDLPSAIG